MSTNETINILYSGNDYAFDGISMSLISVTKYCTKPLNIYVFTMDLTELNPKFKPITQLHANYLSQIAHTANKQSKVTIVDVTAQYKEKLAHSKNTESMYTPYAFIRLLLHLAPNMPDKILYLDYDTIACRDISELYDTDITNYEYAATKDYYGKIFISPKYINSGVLLINVTKIKETNLFEKCLDLINTKKLGFPDQTALNKMCISKKIMPRKFNDQKKLHKDTVIRHFSKTIIWLPYFHTRNTKPWNLEMLHKRRIYWVDDIYKEYTNIKKQYLQEVNSKGDK